MRTSTKSQDGPRHSARAILGMARPTLAETSSGRSDLSHHVQLCFGARKGGHGSHSREMAFRDHEEVPRSDGEDVQESHTVLVLVHLTPTFVSSLLASMWPRGASQTARAGQPTLNAGSRPLIISQNAQSSSGSPDQSFRGRRASPPAPDASLSEDAEKAPAGADSEQR